MRRCRIFLVCVGLAISPQGWTNDIAIEKYDAYPQELQLFESGYLIQVNQYRRNHNISSAQPLVIDMEKLSNSSEVVPVVLTLLSGITAIKTPVVSPWNKGGGGERNKIKKTSSLSPTNSYVTLRKFRRRTRSSGALPSFCSAAPTDGSQHMLSSATDGSAVQFYKLPLPPHKPIKGAMRIDPGAAARKLGDDLANDLKEFMRQTLPGVQREDFQSSTELTVYASHYRTTYGQMEPVRKPGQSPKYVGLGQAGSIGDTFRQMRKLNAEALSEEEKGAGAIGGNIEDSNFFTHMQNTRKFLGRQEKNRYFQMDYRRTGFSHGEYSLGNEASLTQIQQLGDLVQDMMKIVQMVIGENSRLGIDASPINHEMFLTSENAVITVNAAPPEWIDFLVQILLYDLYKSFNSITNQEQLLNKMANFGAMFMLIHPFSECNELTLINLFKMTIDLLMTNNLQLDFNGLVFAEKYSVSKPFMALILQSLLNARIMDGRVVHVSVHTGSQKIAVTEDSAASTDSDRSELSPEPETEEHDSPKEYHFPIERTDTPDRGDVLI